MELRGHIVLTPQVAPRNAVFGVPDAGLAVAGMGVGRVRHV